MLRRIPAFFLVGIAAAAQDPTTEIKPAVHGVVSEVGTQQPLGQVDVLLFRRGVPGARPDPKDACASTKTGADGHFELNPDDIGDYVLAIVKEGWISAGSSIMGFPTTYENVSLSKEHPVRNLTLSMSQPATLSGTVVSEEDGQPVTGRILMVWRVTYRAGRRSPMMSGLASTGKDSSFSFACGRLPDSVGTTLTRP